MSTDSAIPNASDRAAYWRAGLGLQVLEGESGWWASVTRSTPQAEDGETTGDASSCIYYLLDTNRPVNVWHWLASADTHVLIGGGPVDYVLLPDQQPARRETLGRDLAAGQTPVGAAPAGCWKELRLSPGTDYALIGTTVSPAWIPDRVQIGLPDHIRTTGTGTLAHQHPPRHPQPRPPHPPRRDP